MRTESTKNFKSGFVLTEAELRRIIGVMEDQLNKLPGPPHVTTTFDMKYRNGALATTPSLDEVLSQENLGSSQLVELKIQCNAGDNAEANSVSMQFRDLDLASESDVTSINFAVKGAERDWTFVTSSLLEERVLKTKRPALGRFLGIHTEWELFVYFTALLSGLMILVFVQMSGFNNESSYTPSYQRQASESSTPNEEPAKEVPFSEEIEAKIKTENIKDPIQVMIVREKLLEEREKKYAVEENERRKKRLETLYQSQQEIEQQINSTKSNRALKIILYGFIPPLLLYLIRTFLLLYYPTYNFAWGDYLDVFRRKESVRKFVVVVIFIGIVVSFIGGVLANFIRIWN